MNEDFQRILRQELKKEFEEQLGLTVNQTELKKVIKEYKKRRGSTPPLH